MHCCETLTFCILKRKSFVSFLICARCETPLLTACQSWALRPMREGLRSSLLQSVRLGGVEKSCASSCCCLSLHVHLFFLLLLLLLLLLPHVVQSCSFLPSSTMERAALLPVCLLCWSCTVSVVTAIQRADLLPYGSLNGDLVLAEGDDETSKVLSLPRRLYFYDSPFSQLYVSTIPLTQFACYWLKYLKSNFQSAA